MFYLALQSCSDSSMRQLSGSHGFVSGKKTKNKNRWIVIFVHYHNSNTSSHLKVEINSQNTRIQQTGHDYSSSMSTICVEFSNICYNYKWPNTSTEVTSIYKGGGRTDLRGTGPCH